MGLKNLRDRLMQPHMQPSFVGLFPEDTAKNTRFAINFWTAIGLGGITDGFDRFTEPIEDVRVTMQREAAEGVSADWYTDLSGER